MKKYIIYLILAMIFSFRFSTSIFFGSLYKDNTYNLEIVLKDGKAKILKKEGKDIKKVLLADVDKLENGRYRGKFFVNECKKYEYYDYLYLKALDIAKIKDNKIKKYFRDISERFLENASPSLKNMVKAVVIGENNIHSDLLEKIRYIGIAHIFAMSGLHISIVIYILVSLLNIFIKNKTLKNILLIILTTVYIFTVEISPSIIRAYIMAMVLILNKILSGVYDIKKALIISCLVSLIIKPVWLFSLSFQLSYLSLCGIVYVYPIINKLNILKSKILSCVFFNFSIQIMIVPISIFSFGILPLYSFFSNMIMLPLGSLFIFVSYLGIFFENFYLGFIIYPILEYIYNFFVFMIEFINEYDFLNIEYYNKNILFIYILIFIFVFIGGYLIDNYEYNRKRN